MGWKWLNYSQCADCFIFYHLSCYCHLFVNISMLHYIMHTANVQGPNFRNFPKTFSKDLPTSDDLGIPKKFSYSNF